MAIDITINLNDEREAILQRIVDNVNAQNAWDPTYVPLTPAQWLRRETRDRLDAQGRIYADQDKIGMREAYKLATPEEQAQIDAILAKYRTQRALAQGRNG